MTNFFLSEFGNATGGTRRDGQSLLTSAATRMGTSLPALIADTRLEIAADLIAPGAINDRLLDRGWLDAHASRYKGRCWTVRVEDTYQVRRGFPRLVEVDLPAVEHTDDLRGTEPFRHSPSPGLMSDVFTKAKRSQVMSRIRARGNQGLSGAAREGKVGA